MFGMAIKIRDRHIHRLLREVKGALADDNVKHVIGRAGSTTVRDHLFGMDMSETNALGGKRTHFYANAARATHYELISNGVAIVISHTGIALRRYGGTVRPVNARLLAVPNIKEAHGRRPREFDNLVAVMFGRTGIGALMERSHSDIGSRRTVRGRARRIYYWLVPETHHQPNPDVLPTARELLESVLPPARDYARRTLESRRAR